MSLFYPFRCFLDAFSLSPSEISEDSKDVFVLGSIEDITVALEDSLVTISTIATCSKRSF